MKTKTWTNPKTGNRRIYLTSDLFDKGQNVYLDELWRSDEWTLKSVADTADDYKQFGIQMKVVMTWIKDTFKKSDVSFSEIASLSQ